MVGGTIAKSGGSRACLKRKSECVIKNHKLVEQRGTLEEGRLYILYKRDQKLLEPSLSSTWYSADQLAKLRSEKRSIQALILWMLNKIDRQHKIASGSSSLSADKISWDDVQELELKNFKKVHEEFRTPKKLDMTESLTALKTPADDDKRNIGIKLLEGIATVDEKIGTEAITAVENPPESVSKEPLTKDKLLYQEMQRSIGVVLANWNNLKATLEMLLLDSVENTAKTNKTKAALKKTLTSLETKIMDGDSCYQLLLAEVGSDKTASRRHVCMVGYQSSTGRLQDYTR
mmetsp:Transcript_5269/g.8110  ORF Transcript_5269/g.8110 Transcript_5269/m.8110 type:complete len:289 (+) Transcript_5269:179-1045(+)